MSGIFPKPDMIWSWCVMKTVFVFFVYSPYLLSLMIKSHLLSFSCVLSHLFSLYMARRIFGICDIIFKTKNIPFLGYLIRYPFKGIYSILGNSFFRILMVGGSPAMVTLKFIAISWLIMGMQRVACPNPQSSGATSTVFFLVLIFCHLVLTLKYI